MEMIVFIGVQATGKTTFYTHRFLQSHLRISLDLLKTRYREAALFDACLELGQPFLVDNTNATARERARYIRPARDKNFRTVGYYFQSRIEDALTRNTQRIGKARIPDKGIRGTFGKLELPTLSEGFDALHYVRWGGEGGFYIEEWKDEV